MMGTLTFDGVTLGADTARVLPQDITDALAADRARKAEAVARAYAEHEDECDALARQILHGRGGLIQMRARAYRDLETRWQLNSIRSGLSIAHPEFILSVVREEQRRIDRFVGFSGTIRPSNLSGAALFARWMRRFGQRHEDRALENEVDQTIQALQAAE